MSHNLFSFSSTILVDLQGHCSCSQLAYMPIKVQQTPNGGTHIQFFKVIKSKAVFDQSFIEVYPAL